MNADPKVQIDAYSDGSLRVFLSSRLRPAAGSFMFIHKANTMSEREIKMQVIARLEKIMEHLNEQYGDMFDEGSVHKCGMETLTELLMDDAVRAWQGNETPTTTQADFKDKNLRKTHDIKAPHERKLII